jgi:hypothetical protein
MCIEMLFTERVNNNFLNTKKIFKKNLNMMIMSDSRVLSLTTMLYSRHLDLVGLLT